MKIIITAGGTSEKIDDVRKITNFATGKLGCLTAKEFVRQCGGRIKKIFYVCEKGTAVPSLDCVETVAVSGADEVKAALSHLLTSNKIDAVIHSMAVSDYAVDRLTTVNDLANFIADKLFSLNRYNFKNETELAHFIAACLREDDYLLNNVGKISSDKKNLLLFMKRTPKIISCIKLLQPSTILVGFKLLDGVSRQELFDAGYKILKDNGCDLVLANDLKNIKEKRHEGLLIFPDKSYEEFSTKESIACGIVRNVLNLIDRKVR